MMKITHLYKALIGAAAIFTGAVALSGGVGAQSGEAAEKVVFTTDWSYNGRHAYFFVAQENGYYEEEGLDVEILGGRGSSTVVNEVAAKAVHIGFADAGALVLARGNEDVPVKMVAVVYAAPPHGLFALKSAGISEPKDLEGKTLADAAGSSNYTMFAAYAKAAGIDTSAIEWVFADSTSLPAMLVNEQVDAIGQYLVGFPLLAARAAPKEIVYIAYKDGGLDIYSNGLIVHEDMINESPEVIEKFVRATQKGLRDACQDPEAAGAIIHKYHRQVEPEIGAGEMQMVCDIAISADAQEHGLGYIDPEKMQNTIDIIAEVEDLRHELSAADVHAPGFVSEDLKP
jgi:NitT/TauT family transport system substrate-binding protein